MWICVAHSVSFCVFELSVNTAEAQKDTWAV